MNDVLNVCAYRFVELADPARWCAAIRAEAEARALRGTVLLAHEGINLFLAGAAAPLRAFLGWLDTHAPFSGMARRESRSDAVPFGRLVVKVRREIIRTDDLALRPHHGRAPGVDPATLARWLDAGVDDAGREVLMLDTRNAFEVDHGRFRGALDWRLTRFGEFGEALRAHRDELDGKTVVSYCTGGIRCEKAALLMARAGVAHVLQLDGGILNYFEVAGGRHFDGSCFVFDARERLDATLRPAAAIGSV